MIQPDEPKSVTIPELRHEGLPLTSEPLTLVICRRVKTVDETDVVAHINGELVVWDAAGRLPLERLQNRLARRGVGAARAAEEWPADFVAFDLLRLSGTDTTGWPYRRRRAALESVFATRQLSAPLTLCPSTTEADVARECLTWASVVWRGWSSRD
jgi:ATP-dependent DNA ligase